MPQRVSSPEFVGRGPELAAMLAALERAAEGEFAAPSSPPPPRPSPPG